MGGIAKDLLQRRERENVAMSGQDNLRMFCG
jgi:hypothetical protein